MYDNESVIFGVVVSSESIEVCAAFSGVVMTVDGISLVVVFCCSVTGSVVVFMVDKFCTEVISDDDPSVVKYTFKFRLS